MRTNTTLKTKAMSLLLAIVMLLGMMPMAAHAAETTYYTITYTDGVDGEVIFEDQSYEIAAGESIVYFSGSLEREGYVFNGWTPELERTVTADATYTALWNEWIETGYTITYTDGVDGEEIFEDQVYTDVASGTNTPAFEGTPTRTGFTFKGWTPDVADTVTGDATYTALWEEIHTHSYSTATCSTPATCSCGATTGDVDSANHAETYWVKLDTLHRMRCVACDTALTDLERHVYDNDDDVICNICEYEREASHGDAHIWSENWTSNETHHWHNCTADGPCYLATESRNGYATHSFADKAVAIDGDVHARKCTVCNRTLEQESHNFDVVEAEGADGHRIRCSECGGSKLEAHVFVDDSDAICDTCGYVRSIAHTHAYTTWKPSEYNPEAYHVLCCSVCGEMSDPVQVAGHNYEVKNDKEGHWNLCTDCGYTTAKTAHRMTVSRYDGTSLVHINTCSVCQHEVTENCDFKQGTYADNEDGHWAVCFACGRTHSGIPLQNHVDENADGTCDVCKEKYTPPHTHSYKDKYDSTGHYTECDCGEKTEVQAHSYTGMFDSTCDCGYNRGLFEVGTVDKDYVDVGFIPGDGVTLPDDAELVVEEHYPSLAPIASTIVKKTSLGDLRCPEEYDTLTDEDAVLIYGIKCKLYETLVIGGKEYILWGSSQDGPVLLSLPYGLGMVYNRETGIIDKYRDSSFDRKVEKPTNTTVTIDGVTYDVACIVNNSTYILYRDGQLAGMYPSTDVAAELHGSVQFYEGYDPETLKAQQDDNDLGSVTIPADYNNAAIADFAPGKTYKVSVIGSNDISVEGLTDVNGTVTQTFKIPDALVGAKNVKYVAVHDTNPYAVGLAAAEQAVKNNPYDETIQLIYENVKSLYDGWEAKNGSGAEFGTVTLSLDGLTLTATHTAVKGFSPFIVYAFVEADEPEYKELSATLHTEHTYENGKCTVCQAVDPDYVPESSSPQTGDNSHVALWIACAFISGGAVITLTVVDRKRRNANSK